MIRLLRAKAAARSLIFPRQNSLLVYDLDLFIEYFAGEPIDRHVHPVMLFPFYDEIVLETGGIWLVATSLGYHINYQVPNPGLRNRRNGTRNNFPSSLNGLIII